MQKFEATKALESHERECSRSSLHAHVSDFQATSADPEWWHKFRCHGSGEDSENRY